MPRAQDAAARAPRDPEREADEARRRERIREMGRIDRMKAGGMTDEQIAATLRAEGQCITAANVASMLKRLAEARGLGLAEPECLDHAASCFQDDPPPDDAQDATFVDCRDPQGGRPVRIHLEPYLLPRSWDPPDPRKRRSWFSRVAPWDKLCVRLKGRRYAEIDLETQEGVILTRGQAQRWFPEHGRADDLPDDLREVAIVPPTLGDRKPAAKRGTKAPAKRLKPGEAAFKIRAALESLASEEKWNVAEEEIIERAGVPKSTYYRVRRLDDGVKAAMERYHDRRRGRGPLHAKDL
jgi:hypothetical protein